MRAGGHDHGHTSLKGQAAPVAGKHLQLRNWGGRRSRLMALTTRIMVVVVIGVIMVVVGQTMAKGIATGEVASLAAIAATAMIMGYLIMKLSAKGSCLGGRIIQRRLAGARKWPKRVVVVVETDLKNVVTNDNCGSTGGHERHE